MTTNSKTGSSWLLVYTKSKEEIRAKENLEKQGFQTLLPLLSVERVKSFRKVETLKPIFPRYLFTKVDLKGDNWSLIKSTRGVSKIVLFGDKFASVPETSIKGITSKLDSKGIFYQQSHLKTFEKGDKVTIKSGAFAGIEGIFLSKKSKERVTLLLKFLETSIVSDIPKTDLGNVEQVNPIKF